MHKASILGLCYDELFHIPIGYATVQTGHHLLNLQHPPLGKYLTGIALQGMTPLYDYNYYMTPGAHQYEFGRRFWEVNAANIKELLLTARTPFVVLSCFLLTYIFLFSRALYGLAAGVVSTVLAAFCPVFLAHGTFVTFDVPVTAFAVAAIAHLFWYLQQNKKIHFYGCSIFLALALLAKFSAVFFLPSVAIGLLFKKQLRPLQENHKIDSSQGFLKSNLFDFFLCGLIVYVLLWIGYGFPQTPRFYLDGIKLLKSDHNPDALFYLNGEFGQWWWNYFAYAFLFKSTVPFLLIVLTALGTFIFTSFKKQHHRPHSFEFWVLIVPTMLVFFFTSWKAAPIGVRYLMPCYGLLYIFAGSTAVIFSKENRVAQKILKRALPLLVFWHAAESVQIFPHHLGYFNQLAGGSDNGIMHLADSNLDWGEELPLLAKWLKEQGDPSVYMLYFGTDSPEAYGIKRIAVSQRDWDRPFSPGIYVISAQWLVYGQYDSQKGVHTNWLNTYTPVKKIGNAFWIYRFRPPVPTSE